MNETIALNITENGSADPKRKKTLSKVASMASVLSTQVAKAFKRSFSNARIPTGSPAPTCPPPSRTKSELPNTPGRFFMRSASTAKVLQNHNSNTPESPMPLKRNGLGRNSSTNLTPYK